jgi:hypothetical protein
MKEEGNLVQLRQLRCRLLTPCYSILSLTVTEYGYIDFISASKLNYSKINSRKYTKDKTNTFHETI